MMSCSSRADPLSGVKSWRARSVVEIANLTSAQTGIPARSSSRRRWAQHGPRVKYFVQPGRTQPSFSVSLGGIAGGRRQQPAGPDRPPDVAASDRLGTAEQRRVAGFLASRRYLDAARGERLHAKAAARLKRGSADDRSDPVYARRRRGRGAAGRDDLAGRRPARRRDPASVLAAEARLPRRRQLPRLHGRDRGRAGARRVVHPQADRRA